MIKSRLKKAILVTALLGTTLVADSSDYMYDGYSLLGIEGGYNELSAEMTDLNGVVDYNQLDDQAFHLGLKLGAQTGHYRIFLAARTYMDTDDNFDYLTTYGVEGQYLFTMANWADFFIGVGGGVANAKYNVSSEPYARTINDPYFSGELGFNIHATEWIDVEVGGRYVSIDATNTQDNDIEYRLNDMVTGYTSIIFKYKMD